MPNTPAPCIVFESSEQHRAAPSVVHFGSLDEINNPEIGKLEVYGRTKLAIILGVKYGLLDRVIKPNNDNIYALLVHPGAVTYMKPNTSAIPCLQLEHVQRSYMICAERLNAPPILPKPSRTINLADPDYGAC
jgi:hypothetical protein